MFTHHAHSNYSFLEGTIKIPDLISFAKSQSAGYVTLTDTNGMYGLIQFAKEAEEAGIKPVLGSYIDDVLNKSNYAIFLAKNNKGYSELCKIITTRKLGAEFSLARVIETISPNLFILTSSLNLLKKLTFSERLKNNLFVELIVTKKQKKKTRELFEFARAKGLKIVASHPAYFLHPEDFLMHKVAAAIRLNKTLGTLESNDTIDEEYWLRAPLDLENVWHSLPEAIWNSDYIAKNCNVNLKFGDYKYPTYPLPEGETAFSLLWKIAFRGLEEKYRPITERAVKRLQYELEVIDELGFSDYFLIVWDIVREAKQRNMMTIGRGSAANSLTAFCLGITQVDPLKYNLYFERFLNRGRTSPPDIDLDFSWKERDEIVRYVFEKYGYDKVAMISTTVTFRARSAFREVAKVFGVSEKEISKYGKFIPWTSAKNSPQISEKFPETKNLAFEEEPWNSIVKIAAKFAGYPRHLGIHPGGIVITPEPINNYTALEFAANKGLGLIITQPDMYSVEDLGLIKIDLLSQRSLGVLKDTVEMLTVNRERGRI